MVSLPRPGAATYMDDTGFEGDLVIDAIADAVEGLYASLIINGNMDHFQRSPTGASVTSTTTYSTNTSYSADRIFVLPAGASVTQARSTTVPDSKSQYSLAVTGAASVTTLDIGQRVRQAIVATRGLQSLVFSCNIRNESGAAYTPTLRVGTPAVANDFTTVTNRLSQSLQSCADSAWTRVFWVFDPSAYTNIANGMEVVLRIPSGSSVAGDMNRIAQFDLRPGGSLVPYVPPDPDQQLLSALRSFERIAYNASLERLGVGSCSDTATVRWVQPWRVRKHGTPAIRFSDTTHIGVGVAATPNTVITGTLATSGGVGLDSAGLAITSVTGSPLTAGHAVMVSWNNSAGFIDVDSEN